MRARLSMMRCSVWRALGALLPAAGACASAGDAGPDLGSSALAACADSRCTALAGPCQQASCDPGSGLCRVRAAREGEACLEGNPCGPARCRAGECVPIDPPACSELDDACWRGVCEIAQGGCVAEPRDIPGARCETAVPIVARGRGLASADVTCAGHSTSVPGCIPTSLGGPSAHFELDLRDAGEPTSVTLIIDAERTFEAALTHGACDDPGLVACAEPFYLDGASRRIQHTLEPGLYHLVVTGTNESGLGSVQVASSIGPTAVDAAPAHDDCDGALALDVSRSPQSVFVDFAGATPEIVNRCEDGTSADVFYRLDLSNRPSTLLDVGVRDGLRASLFAVGATACGEFMACGAGFSLQVPAGIYNLGVSQYTRATSSEPDAVRVGFDSVDCSTTQNDVVETATELDPMLERQHISGNTVCGKDDLSAMCGPDQLAPDLFYRLDLRSRTAPTELALFGKVVTGLLTYVLTHPKESDALALTDCAGVSKDYAGRDYVLAPRLYYIAIDGEARNAGPFDLDVALTPRSEAPLSCVPPDFSCPLDSEPSCRVSRAHPDCLRAYVECGLSPEVYARFCNDAADCCEGLAELEGCFAAWRSAVTCSE